MEVMNIHSSAKRLKMLLIYSSITLAIMLIELFFREGLFALSADIIIYLQTTFPSKGTQWFFRFISGLGTPSLIVPMFLIIYAAEAKKFLTIKLTLYICFVGYTVSIMKSIYSNPRPYWIYPYMTNLANYKPPGIIPFEKYAEYGNPSGHAFLCTSFYGYLYYIFLYKKAHGKSGIGADEKSLHVPSITESEMQEEHERKKTKSKKHKTTHESVEAEDEVVDIPLPDQYPTQEVKKSKLFYILSAVYFGIISLICVSRMYLGMHALNQVLLGLTLGGYFLFIIIYYIDPVLDVFLKKVRHKKIHNRTLLIVSYIVSYIILSAIPVFLFQKNAADDTTEWTVWWPVVSQEVNVPKFTFAHIKCLLDCGIIGMAFGVAAALLSTERNYLDQGLRLGAVTKLALLFRILVFLLTVGVVAGIFVIIPTPEGNWPVKYLINSNFAAFAGAYVAVHFAPVAYEKFGLGADRFFNHPREMHIDHSFVI